MSGVALTSNPKKKGNTEEILKIETAKVNIGSVKPLPYLGI